MFRVFVAYQVPPSRNGPGPHFSLWWSSRVPPRCSPMRPYSSVSRASRPPGSRNRSLSYPDPKSSRWYSASSVSCGPGKGCVSERSTKRNITQRERAECEAIETFPDTPRLFSSTGPPEGGGRTKRCAMCYSNTWHVCDRIETRQRTVRPLPLQTQPTSCSRLLNLMGSGKPRTAPRTSSAAAASSLASTETAVSSIFTCSACSPATSAQDLAAGSQSRKRENLSFERNEKPRRRATCSKRFRSMCTRLHESVRSEACIGELGLN